MKAFIALCLVALAVAEPEADPAVYYSGLGYNYHHNAYAGHPFAYNNYAYARAPYAYNTYSSYPHNYAYSRLFKREAEAEAEADPQYFYGNRFAYNSHPFAYSTGYPHAYNNYAYTHAPYAYNHLAYAAPTHVTQANGAVSSTAAIHSGVRNPFVGGYANAGNYVANSAGVVHVAKREAEAEAEADPQYFYGNRFSYGRRAFGGYGYSAYAPYSYGYRSSYGNPYTYGRYHY